MAHKLVVMEWLYKADQDFGFASFALLREKRLYFDQLCFFFQQAAEKYLKAYIIKFDLKFTKQHDLLKLLETCREQDLSLKELEDECRFLNSFYMEFRYADQVFAVATFEQTQEAQEAAEKIQKTIRQKLNVTQEITIEEIRKESKKVDEELKAPKLDKRRKTL